MLNRRWWKGLDYASYKEHVRFSHIPPFTNCARCNCSKLSEDPYGERSNPAVGRVRAANAKKKHKQFCFLDTAGTQH